MADKSAFTADEWQALRDAPQLISLAVASSGASGLIGTLKEMFSSGAAIVGAMKSDVPLLRTLGSQPELADAQRSLRDVAGELKGVEFAQVRQRIETRTLDTLRTALDALQHKAPEDYDAYAAFVKRLAQRVAEAAKEGGFLGFGGERISEGERQLLAKLDGALAAQPFSGSP